MSLVNKHRLRLFNENNNNDDNTLYQDAQVLLQEEVNRLSEIELDLRSQKQYKELQLEIAKANHQVAIANDNNENNNINRNNNNIDNHALPMVQNEDSKESDIRVNTTMVVMHF